MTCIGPYFSSLLPIPSPEGRSFWKNSAVIVGKVVLAILAFSAISAGTGKAMQIGGIRLVSATEINPSLTNQIANNVGLGLQQAGKGLFLIGKYTFLSVAVPTYATLYVLPKWVFKEGLPKAARLAHQYVVIPVYNRIIQATRFISEQCIKIAQAIYNHVLAPLGNLVEKAAVWTWEVVIIPVINKVVQATTALKDAIVHVAQAIYNHVLAPLGNLIEKAAVWTWEVVIIPVINKVVQAITVLKDTIVHVAQAIYNHVLAPLGNLVEKAAVWTWKAVIIPVVNGIAQGYGIIKDLVIPIAQRVYNYALKPLGKFISHAFGVAIEHTGHVLMVVASAGNAVVSSVYETYLRLMGGR